MVKEQRMFLGYNYAGATTGSLSRSISFPHHTVTMAAGGTVELPPSTELAGAEPPPFSPELPFTTPFPSSDIAATWPAKPVTGFGDSLFTASRKFVAPFTPLAVGRLTSLGSVP